MTAGTLVLHPGQVEAFASQAKETVLVAGIRSGKTHVGAARTILRAYDDPTEPDQCHAVVSPTYPMSRLGPEPKLHKLLGDPKVFPPWMLADFIKSERTFLVRNRLGRLSRIRIFTGEHPDRWRGDAWRSGWFDEGAMLTLDAYRIGQGRLADTDGPVIITTTPAGTNFVFDLVQRCERLLPRVGYMARASVDGRTLALSWSSTFNTFLPATAARAFEEMRGQYDPDFYAQEIEAQFVAKAGRVYRGFERARNVFEVPVSLPSVPEVFVGQDFNVGRMCSAFLVEQAFPTIGSGLFLVDEMEIRDADTFVLVRRLEEWCFKNGVPKTRLTIVPDASSRKRQTAAHRDTARSDLEILQRAGFRVRGPRSNPPVKDRINSVNALLWAGRLVISPRCRLTLDALDRQPWGEDGEPLKDGVLDNRADALGYPVWYRFPLRPPRATLGANGGT